MTRRLFGLLAALCLISACKDEPVGQMQPIVPPPGTPTTPAPKVEAPKQAPEPPPDPSKVVLRWKLDAPTAFRLTTTASEADAPPPAAKGKKGKPPAASGSKTSETSALFVMQKTETGDYAFRIVPQEPGGLADEGTMSERGFVLDGLAPPLRNTAVLVLELPRDPVGPGATWSLGADLVDVGAVNGFVEKKSERHNQVKLTALTPGDNGEQVATIEYELSETLSGQVRSSKPASPAPKPDKKVPAKGKKGEEEEEVDEHGVDHDESDKPMLDTSADVRVKGKGEFLVKAGRWRSWQATLTTQTTGAALPGVTPGERTLRLTPVEPVPPELLKPPTKK